MDKVIDLDTLREKYTEDALPYHIWSVALDCKQRSLAFWLHCMRMKFRHNVISIPLLIFSSITGVSSVAQIGSSGTNYGLSVIVTIFGVTTAILTALQRYFRYSERAEESKYMAKNYAKISRMIQHNMTLVESKAIQFQPEAFLKFVEGFHKEIDTILSEATDLPHELLPRKDPSGPCCGSGGDRDRIPRKRRRGQGKEKMASRYGNETHQIAQRIRSIEYDKIRKMNGPAAPIPLPKEEDSAQYVTAEIAAVAEEEAVFPGGPGIGGRFLKQTLSWIRSRPILRNGDMTPTMMTSPATSPATTPRLP